MDLDQKERILLANFCRHDGFKIFVDKILGDTCQGATQDLLKCDPVQQDKVRVMQMRARHFNEFADLILKTLNWQVLEGIAQQAIQDQTAQQETDNDHGS